MTHPFLAVLADAPIETDAQVRERQRRERERALDAEARRAQAEWHYRRTPEFFADRDKRICQMIDAGCTTVDVGDAFGLSHQRISQIVAVRDARRRQAWIAAKKNARKRTPGQQIDALMRNRQVLDVVAACDA